MPVRGTGFGLGFATGHQAHYSYTTAMQPASFPLSALKASIRLDHPRRRKKVAFAVRPAMTAAVQRSAGPDGKPPSGTPAAPAPMAPGDQAPKGTPGTGETVCPDCGGSGKASAGAPCPTCVGTGVVNVGIGGG